MKIRMTYKEARHAQYALLRTRHALNTHTDRQTYLAVEGVISVDNKNFTSFDRLNRKVSGSVY